jgi:hypothetical protein
MMRRAIGKSLGVLVAATLGTALSIAPALAANGYALFGDATYVHPGFASQTAVQLRSSTVAPGYGGIDFSVPAGMTFSQIQNLSTEYQFTAGSCGSGAPRFSINFALNINAFVYIGPPPNYTLCPQNVWANTGNLATPGSFVDTSQLGGTFYDTFAAADVKFGSKVVTGIQLVTDSGGSFGGTQTVLVDNVMINDTTYTFESAQSCKDGGWQQFASSPGPFKNQGDCVSYFATGGTNG